MLVNILLNPSQVEALKVLSVFYVCTFTQVGQSHNCSINIPMYLMLITYQWVV